MTDQEKLHHQTKRADDSRIAELAERFEQVLQPIPEKVRDMYVPYALEKQRLLEQVQKVEELFSSEQYAEAYRALQDINLKFGTDALNGFYSQCHMIHSIICHEGLGGQKVNHVYSFAQMRNAAYEDYPAAFYPLAEKYAQGDGCTVDLLEARYWARKARAEYAPDAEKAAFLLQRIGEADPDPDADALAKKGMDLFEQNRVDDAIVCFKKAALCESPNESAMNNLAILYNGGSGVKENCTESLRWRKEAAQRGFTDAFEKLAIMYLLGGDDRLSGANIEKALYWMRRADTETTRPYVAPLEAFLSENIEDHLTQADALMDIANVYGENHLDGWKRRILYLNAVYGHLPSMFNLAVYYDNTQNYKFPFKTMASYWVLQFTTKTDDRLAAFLMALRYQDGNYIARDLSQARYWAEKAKSLPETDRDREFVGDRLDPLLKELSNVTAAQGPIPFALPEVPEKIPVPTRVIRPAQTASKPAKAANPAKPATFPKDLPLPYEDIPKYPQRMEENRKAFEQGKAAYDEGDYTTAFPLIQQASNAGYAEAMYDLSIMWLNGLGAPHKNDRFSFTWMQKAAYEGYAPAYQMLMFKYYNGIGTEKDMDEARFWAQKALDKNPDLAPIQNILNTLGGKRVFDENEFNIGFNAYQQKNYNLAFQCFKRQAYADHPISCFNLGVMYAKGQGTAENFVQSFRWMRNAAELGYKDAYETLARKYLTGSGTSINIEKAQEWVDVAKAKGAKVNPEYEPLIRQLSAGDYDSDLLNLLVEWYQKGHYKESFEATYHISLKGNANLMNNLSVYYAKGLGTTEDRQKSFYWMRAAAENGYTESYYTLAAKYYTADGTAKDLKQARTWAQKAVEASASQKKDAQNLIRIVDSELGAGQNANNGPVLIKGADPGRVEADFKEGERLYKMGRYVDALSYFERAGRAGHGDALFYISEYYGQGILVPQNFTNSEAFFVEAFIHNSALAKERMSDTLSATCTPYHLMRFLRAEPGTDRELMNIRIEDGKDFMLMSIENSDWERRSHVSQVRNRQRESFKYATGAAGAGNPDALILLGDNEGVHFYKLAAMYGHSYAWYILGEHYRPTNAAVADRCYIEGAKRGCEEAKSACEIRNLNY